MNNEGTAAITRWSSESADVDSTVLLSARLLVDRFGLKSFRGLSTMLLLMLGLLIQGWKLSAVARLPSPAIHETLGTQRFAFDSQSCVACDMQIPTNVHPKCIIASTEFRAPCHRKHLVHALLCAIKN